jgi:hypothetical protein
VTTNAQVEAVAVGDRTLLRVGGAMAVVGVIMGLTGNVLHPRSTGYYGDPVAWLNHNTDIDIWFPSHALLLLSSIVLVGGFVAFTRSLAGTGGYGLASVALAFAVMGSAVYGVTVAIDGLTVPQLADAWTVSDSPSPDAVLAGSIMYHTIFSLLYVSMIPLFGLAPVFYGLAFLRGGVFSGHVGRAGVLFGSSVVVAGLLSMFGIATEFIDAVIWPVVASLVNFWNLLLGVLLWRRTSRTAAP